MTRLAQTCACGAQFSVDDTYRHASYVYEELEKWRTQHICPLRETSSFAGKKIQFCGRTDLDPHLPHHWGRLPDGSYDPDEYLQASELTWCPGQMYLTEEPRPVTIHRDITEDGTIP